MFQRQRQPRKNISTKKKQPKKKKKSTTTATTRKRSKINTIHLILVGDSAVGKTSLLSRYSTNTYEDRFLTTIGLDYKILKVHISGRDVTLCLWDTAGQERFQSITPSFYRNASGILMVYDVKDYATFQNCTKWMEQIKKDATVARNDKLRIVLVGNKIDCHVNERQVKQIDGQRLANIFGLHFMETSAKENINVHNTFHLVTKLIVDGMIEEEKEEGREGGGGKEEGKAANRKETHHFKNNNVTIRLQNENVNKTSKIFGCC
jgi:small GTP-binding protein